MSRRVARTPRLPTDRLVDRVWRELVKALLVLEQGCSEEWR